MKGQNPDVKFICFSDDLSWMRDNLPLGKDAMFVDWNTGTDSPLDMYMMSQCDNAIIANSSFSYWGAYLGKTKDTVIYPNRWWNMPEGNPDLFWDEWIAM